MQLTELELIGAVNKKNSCPESCPEIFIRNFHQMLREIPRPLGRGGIARNAKRSPLLALLLVRSAIRVEWVQAFHLLGRETLPRKGPGDGSLAASLPSPMLRSGITPQSVSCLPYACLQPGLPELGTEEASQGRS